MKIVLLALFNLLIAACGGRSSLPDSQAHLQQAAVKSQQGSIPQISPGAFPAPNRPASKRHDTFSVTVDRIPVHDLLFILARDAELNLDLHEGVSGTITLNAIDQSLPAILSRIARQCDLRYDLDDKLLVVMPDTPYLHHYALDYLNIARQVSGSIATNTQIATAAPGAGSTGPASSANISNTRIENNSRHAFWEEIEKSVRDLLQETDKPLPSGSSETSVEQQQSQSITGVGTQPVPSRARGRHIPTHAPGTQTVPIASTQRQDGKSLIRRSTVREAVAVIANPEAGLLSVRATRRQHERVQAYIDLITRAIRRQVMIEASIVEVELADAYRQGIEWSRLRDDKSGFSVSAPGNPGSIAGVANFIVRQLDKPLNLVAAINLLEHFGSIRVLSSPRISVLNNQTALLKVVENYVYFNVKADTTTTANVGTSTTYTTTPQTVSVGLVMGVTPQISANGEITLNIRPTITSVAREVRDPNPSLTIENRVPVIRTREIESVMRLSTGEIAVLGGLMEDSLNLARDRVPLAGAIPGAGELLTRRENSARKSELVIFLRPVQIMDSSVRGDYAALAGHLPNTDFFRKPPHDAPR